MTTNFDMAKYTALFKQLTSPTHYPNSLESPTPIKEIVFNDTTDANNIISELGPFALQSPSEFLLFSDPKETPDLPSEDKLDRDGLDAMETAFWVYNDHESLFSAHKYSTDNLFQDCFLRKRSTPVITTTLEPQILNVVKKLEPDFNEGPNKKLKKGSGCACSKSKCLRLHCRCFSQLGYCGPDCGCVDCYNTKAFDEERQFVIEKTKSIFPDAFKSKLVKTSEQLVLNSHGCRCNTGCRKNYCDCFKNGAGCSPICKCLSCNNTKIDLPPEKVRQHYAPALRNKDRILILTPEHESDKRDFKKELEDSSRDTADMDSRTDSRKCLIAFRDYKKEKLIASPVGGSRNTGSFRCLDQNY
jgi:hypothetical protein